MRLRWDAGSLFAAVALAPLAAGPRTLAQTPGKPVYRITGVAVSTRDGAPVPYCRMQVSESAQVASLQAGPRSPGGNGQQRGRRAEPTEVEADARGHFQITLPHAGSYVLSGSARNYRRQNFDAHESFTASVVVTPAAPVAEVTFRLERDASITGLVLDEAGEPVRSAQVVAESPGAAEERGGRFGRFGGEGRQAGFAQTDDRGRYELGGLAPGSYRVRVTAQPWYAQGQRFGRSAAADPSPDPSLDVVYPVTWFPGVQEDSSAELLKLAGGEERQADFHLTASPSVHLVVPRPEPVTAADGQVRPQRGAIITKLSPPGNFFGQGSTTNGTTQDFGWLSPGLYELRTTGPDGRPSADARQFRILPGSSGVVDLSTATPLTRVTLLYDGVDASEAGQITFTEIASGRSVTPEGGFGGRRRTDSGDEKPERYVNLAPGQWKVKGPSGRSTYLASLDVKGATADGFLLNVTGEPVTLTLHLGDGRGEIGGFVRSGGKAVEGAMVLLVPITLGQLGSGVEVQRDETNTDGSFALPFVVPGKYILLAIDRGWSVKWQELATLANYLPRGIPVEVQKGGKLVEEVTAAEP